MKTTQVSFALTNFCLNLGDLTHSQQDGNDSLDTSGSSTSTILSPKNFRSDPSKYSRPEPKFLKSDSLISPSKFLRTESLISPSKRKRKSKMDSLLQEGILHQEDEDSEGNHNFFSKTFRNWAKFHLSCFQKYGNRFGGSEGAAPYKA